MRNYFCKNLLAYQIEKKYDIFLKSNVWYKNENNNDYDVSHINIHLPISTNKKMGMNAMNLEQYIVLLNFWLGSFFFPIKSLIDIKKSLIDINIFNNHMPACQKIKLVKLRYKTTCKYLWGAQTHSSYCLCSFFFIKPRNRCDYFSQRLPTLVNN